MPERLRKAVRRRRRYEPRPLFVAGCQRSGTTAFAEYVNCHPAILVCQERYKLLPVGQVTPERFTFERILAQAPGETDDWRAELHASLLGQKDAKELRWIGDKNPLYVRGLKKLAAKNPGARFIILFRSLEEVAESFEARATDPHDHWPAENGFEVGVTFWNKALESARQFVEDGGSDHLLLVDYHRFFGNPTSERAMLESFLEVEFDARIVEAWSRLSSEFLRGRRPKRKLSPEQRALVESRKDRALEEWALNFLATHTRGRGR